RNAALARPIADGTTERISPRYGVDYRKPYPVLRRLQQHLWPDGHVAHAHACRVPDRVGDRRSDPHGAELADASRTDRTGMRIDFIDERDVHATEIGVHGQQIAGEILGEIASQRAIHFRGLEQRLPDAPGHAADHLALRGLRVDDASRAVDADQPRDARDEERL